MKRGHFLSTRLPLTLFASALPLLSLAAPRGLSLYLAVLALLTVGTLWRQHRRCPLVHRPTLPLILFWLCAGWFLISTSWSVSTRNWEMARDTAIVVTSASLLFLSLPGWPSLLRRSVLTAFAIGFGCSLIYLCLQELTDFAINRAFGQLPQQFVMSNTNVPKRMGAMLVLLVWPAAAWLALQLPQRYRPAAWLLIVPALALTPGLYSRAAMIGGLIGLGLLLVTRWRPRVAAGIGLWLLPLAIAVTLTGMSLLPWLAPRIDPFLPFSGQERLQIWQDVLRQGITLWPWGAGLDGSRAYTFATHPHNVYLQLFFDGGLPGVLLASLLFGFGWSYLRRAPRVLQPYFWGFVGAQFCMLSIAYGIWQAWWLAGNILAVFLLALISQMPTTTKHGGGGRTKLEPGG